MLSDPTFINIVPFKKIGPAIQVTANWFVELKRGESDANVRINPAKKGGLELSWEAPLRRARVWQPLNQQSLGARTGSLDFSVTVNLSAATSDVIEWIAILQEYDGDIRFYEKFKHSVSRTDDELTVIGLASGVRLEPDRKYRLCIQFSSAPSKLTLHSVFGSAKKLSSSKGLDKSAMRSMQRELDDIERKLWGGYSKLAVEELTRLYKSRTTHREARARAAWELARWYSVQGRYREAVNLLKAARNQSQVFARQKPFRLVEIDALLRGGELDQALQRIKDAHSVVDGDSDYGLAYANYCLAAERAGVEIAVGYDTARLNEINAVFEHNDLEPVWHDPRYERLCIDSLRCDASQKNIDDGPLISVLMAAYGAEEHLHLAVNSILGQTWRNLELIIVEDRSPDRTWELAEEFARRDSRIRLFRNDRNMGAYYSRNEALSHARGQYVTVHDSDDWSHPEMLARQVQPLIESPDLHGTFSMMCRVTPDLEFGIRPSRRNLEIVHRSYPAFLMRREDLNELGQWDDVVANADAELVRRARKRFGKESLVEVDRDTPMSFFLVRPESLTAQAGTSLLSLDFGVRHEYDRQADFVRENSPDGGVLIGRRTDKKSPFAAPENLLSPQMRTERHYDLIIVSDLSLKGGTRSCNLGYIDIAVALGKRVGLFHWPRGDLRLLPDIDPKYRERNQLPLVDILTWEEEVGCARLIVHHPPIMHHRLDRLPRITADEGAILVNQLPFQFRDTDPSMYEPIVVARDFKKLFHVEPVWIPISPIVRRYLAEVAPELPQADSDWFPPLTLPFRETIRTPEPGRLPVLGRHGRDHWTKWPESVEELRNAYAADTDLPVRILGGAGAAMQILRETPANWEILEFDSISVEEFIDSLDFLIHFPHSEYIEEFGRNIAEAMARSVPVILPPHFREVFGDAAIYCEPHEVVATALEVWGDSERYQSVARNGQRFVERNCSPDTVRSRLLLPLRKGQATGAGGDEGFVPRVIGERIA